MIQRLCSGLRVCEDGQVEFGADAHTQRSGMTETQLIEKWIEPNPHRPGADEAQLTGYGVAVWALVGYLSRMDWNVEAVAQAFDVPCEAVEAALAYYRRHKAVIDNRRAANAV